MKQSKNIIVKYIQKFLKNHFPKTIYLYFLFLRLHNKFKRSINKNKTTVLHSDNLYKINRYEFKICSQNNEDGIIDYIFQKIPNEKNFFEIGIGYYEFNSLNLIKKNWSGVLVEKDTDTSLITKLLLKYFFSKSKVRIVNKAVNRDNINDIMINNSYNSKIDFFSIDIDGNDYWVLKETDLNNVSCVCLEYNHWLGANTKKVMPYNEDFSFIDNGIFGASLLAYDELMNLKGFKLIAVDSSGTNAFYINNKFSHLFELLDPIKSFISVGKEYSEKRRSYIFDKIKNYPFLDK
jgi:hypothetical protein